MPFHLDLCLVFQCFTQVYNGDLFIGYWFVFSGTRRRWLSEERLRLRERILEKIILTPEKGFLLLCYAESRAKEVDEATPQSSQISQTWTRKGNRSERVPRAELASSSFREGGAGPSVEKYFNLAADETDKESSSERASNSDTDFEDSDSEDSEIL